MDAPKSKQESNAEYRKEAGELSPDEIEVTIGERKADMLDQD